MTEHVEQATTGDRDKRLRVAVFRPDDERLRSAIDLIESLGGAAVADPMLAIEPTGRIPRSDAEYTVLTSQTGAELLDEMGWTANQTIMCAIGDRTAEALRSIGYSVDLIPEEYSSTGLVEALADEVAGDRVEVARSDHGSVTLLDGLNDAGAYVHETVLYRLARPDGAGESAELAAAGELDVVLFTSSLTVEHFLKAATDRNVKSAVLEALEEIVVGAIGEPTRRTAAEYGVDVDVVPDVADFEALATETIEFAAPTYHG
ncbi:MAG: uroporphyrinogen-III synthase [Halobacteriales archaeon]